MYTRVYTQALRYKRICSDAKELNLQLKILKNAFTALGYKPKIVKNQITKDMSTHRESLLKYHAKSESDHILLVLTYHPYLRPINKIAKNLQSLLNKDYLFFLFILFYLYIYPPDSQESDRGANTYGRQLPRPASGDTKILLSACNLIDI